MCVAVAISAQHNSDVITATKHLKFDTVTSSVELIFLRKAIVHV